MNVAVGAGLAFAAVMAVCLFVLWFGSAVIIDQLEDRMEVLERNWAEQFGAPVADDSPEALAAEEKPCIDHECVGVQVCPRCGGPAVCAYDTCGCDEPDDCPTDEIPISPPTVPDGMPLAVQSALIEQRPSPVPRTDSDDVKARRAAWVESELAKVRARIDAAQEAS